MQGWQTRRQDAACLHAMQPRWSLIEQLKPGCLSRCPLTIMGWVGMPLTTQALMQVGDYEVQPRQVLLPPPLESIPWGLPSAQWSSDHIAVVVDVAISRTVA